MPSGRDFEREVKVLLDQELLAGAFGIEAKNVRTYLNKGYRSKDRDNEIIVDVSIEVFRQGAIEPYLIWIWECKDYSSQVPVNDVEELHAKLEQIGVHRVKGTIACRNGFQKGAIAYAKSKGIGLVRILPGGSVIHIVEALCQREDDFFIQGLTELHAENMQSMFYGLSSQGKWTIRLCDLIELELVLRTAGIE